MSKTWPWRASVVVGMLALLYCILFEVDGVGRFALIVFGVCMEILGLTLASRGQPEQAEGSGRKKD